MSSKCFLFVPKTLISKDKKSSACCELHRNNLVTASTDRTWTFLSYSEVGILLKGRGKTVICVQFILTSPFECIIKFFLTDPSRIAGQSVLKSSSVSQLISYSSYVIFNAAQRVYHPVGIRWAQSSRDEHSQQCIWRPTGLGEGGWGVGGKTVHCPLGCRMNTATAPNISSSQCDWKMLMDFLIA